MKRLIITMMAVGFVAVPASADPVAKFEAMDTNSDGFVIESEFLAYHAAAGTKSQSDAMVAFVLLDKDGSNAISPDEMKADPASSAPPDTKLEKPGMQDGKMPDR